MTHAETMSDERIKVTIPKFKWFVPVNFGNGIIAQSTAWPGGSLESRHVGPSKFDFIVRRNLPDLQGKRVLDLGCNVGVMAIHMVRLGAREVVGIDSETGWPGWREQAHFVKAALEWRCETTYRVRYIESNMADLASLDLGTFDIITALNSLYYLDEDDIARVIRQGAAMAPTFLIQCNTRDQNHLGRRPTPAFMKRMLAENGFADVRVDHPWDRPRRRIVPQRYHRPVVVGTRAT